MSQNPTAAERDFPEGDVHDLDVADFAVLFGTTEDAIGDEFRSQIEEGDFRYVILEGEKKEQILLEVLKRIDSGNLTIAGEAGKGRWDKGWGENLDAFLRNDFDIKKLVPKYIRPKQPVRLNQQYVMPFDPAFELNWYEIYRPWFMETYLAPFDAIFEFGCGSGFNLADFARRHPEKKYVGLDWAAPSRDIINKLAARFKWNMEGRLFDFFHPDNGLEVGSNDAFLTIGALEQTGERWTDFLDFVLEKSPACVFHIEPICEWYDPDNLTDYAAIRFHAVRKYWSGYYARLRELEAVGKVEIIKTKRSNFGSLFLEGYSQLIWKPVK